MRDHLATAFRGDGVNAPDLLQSIRSEVLVRDAHDLLYRVSVSIPETNEDRVLMAECCMLLDRYRERLEQQSRRLAHGDR